MVPVTTAGTLENLQNSLLVEALFDLSLYYTSSCSFERLLHQWTHEMGRFWGFERICRKW